MILLLNKTCRKTVLIVAMGVLYSGFACAASTGFEKVMPAQSSTVFSPEGSEQVIGERPETALEGLRLHEFPALWVVTASTEIITVLPDPPPVIKVTIERSKPKQKKVKKPAKKHKRIKRQLIHKPAVVVCAPTPSNASPDIVSVSKALITSESTPKDNANEQLNSRTGSKKDK